MYIFLKVTGFSCDILEIALKRYNNMLFLKGKKHTKHSHNLSMNFVKGTMEMLEVTLANPCEDYPSLNMNEKC